MGNHGKGHELPGRGRVRFEQIQQKATAPLVYTAQPWTVPYCTPTRVDDGHRITFVERGMSNKRWLAMIPVGFRISTPWESRGP
eukprot:6424935-Pyramimonas_sp.AAC.1